MEGSDLDLGISKSTFSLNHGIGSMEYKEYDLRYNADLSNARHFQSKLFEKQEVPFVFRRTKRASESVLTVLRLGHQRRRHA
jgi:hypothetical protein